jgi:hypothetical protein
MPALVKWYRDRGIRVIAVIGGRSNDVDVQPGDAERIVRELGVDGVDYTSVNEPNNQGWNIDRAIENAEDTLGEIRRVDPSLKIWGPVWSYYNRGDLRRFMDALGDGLGGISYHHYAMGSGSISTGQAMRETPSWGREIREVREDLRSRGLPERVSVTEINFSWRYEDGTPPNGRNDRFFTSINTVWGASVIGHILAAGGQTCVYGNQNGPLGVFTEPGNHDDGRPGGSPQPIHWGIAAWTGARLFPSFDGAVLEGGTGPTDDQDIEVFAVKNTAGGINLICINKSENNDKDVTIELAGSDGQFTRWETSASDPYAPLTDTARGEYHGRLSARLRRMSVSTFVLAPVGGSEVTPPTAVPETTPTLVPVPGPEVAAARAWHVSAGATDASAPAGWRGDASLVAGGTAGSNAGTTRAPEGFPEGVFDTERWGAQKWTIPVPAGTYDVSLAFSERFKGAQVPGGRVFTVKIQDETISGVDVFTQAEGVGGALVITRTVTSDGAITVELVKDAGGDNPFINAISVVEHAVVAPPAAPEVDLSGVVAAYRIAMESLTRAEQQVVVLQRAMEEAFTSLSHAVSELDTLSADLSTLGVAIEDADAQ